MKKKRPSVTKSLVAPKSAKSLQESASDWGFIKEIQEKRANEKESTVAINRNSFGSLKNLTSYQVIQIVSSLTTAAATGDDDGDGACNCANCYNCANCSDDGN